MATSVLSDVELMVAAIVHDFQEYTLIRDQEFVVLSHAETQSVEVAVPTKWLAHAEAVFKQHTGFHFVLRWSHPESFTCYEVFWKPIPEA